VISAYEADPGIPFPALILFGPFMAAERRAWFQERIAVLPKLYGITFAPRVEPLFERALGVVAMGGYNTFCEILSFWKPALIVPRTRPRLEQLIRAERAARLGLVRLLPDDDRHNPFVMAQMLRDLPSWPAPDPRRFPGLLDGLERIAELAAPWLDPSAVPLRWPSYARPA
jgi:predicted glycosyltransferase